MGRIGKFIGFFVLMMVLVFPLIAAEGEKKEEKNLLRNGGFEELTERGDPKYWDPLTKGVSLSEDVKWVGSYAICVTRDDNKESTSYAQYLPPGTFEPDTTYCLTCYIKTKDVMPDTTHKYYPTWTGAGFQIMICEKRMNYFCPAPLFTGTIPWTAQQFTFTTPKEISKTHPYFRIILQQASGTVWFDELCLEKVIEGVI